MTNDGAGLVHSDHWTNATLFLIDALCTQAISLQIRRMDLVSLDSLCGAYFLLTEVKNNAFKYTFGRPSKLTSIGRFRPNILVTGILTVIILFENTPSSIFYEFIQRISRQFGSQSHCPTQTIFVCTPEQCLPYIILNYATVYFLKSCTWRYDFRSSKL